MSIKPAAGYGTPASFGKKGAVPANLIFVSFFRDLMKVVMDAPFQRLIEASIGLA
ncbi:hypothetical protein [Novosphingobium sp.]|uniref:hypothetical protein n=1 Tax=Novosphingobium sp. TaxID=1874826 RepID=UPI0025CBE5BB|nr:hypothetical protein [Novosphingobium sp.]